MAELEVLEMRLWHRMIDMAELEVLEMRLWRRRIDMAELEVLATVEEDEETSWTDIVTALQREGGKVFSNAER